MMVHQRSRRILAQSGFFGSLDTPCSERSWIDLFRGETQNPFSDLTIQSWIFLKKCTLGVCIETGFLGSIMAEMKKLNEIFQ